MFHIWLWFILVRGEALLKEAGYTQEQIQKLPTGAYAYRSGGEIRISGVTSQASLRAADISGRWVGGVGGHYQVQQRGEPFVKETLTEGEFAREIILPERKIIPGLGPEVTYRVDAFTGEIVGRKRLVRIEEPRPVEPKEPVELIVARPIPSEEPIPIRPEPEPPVEETKRFALTPEAAKKYIRGEQPFPEREITALVKPSFVKFESPIGQAGLYVYRGFKGATRAVGYTFGAAGEAFIPKKFKLDIPTGKVKLIPAKGLLGKDFIPSKIEITPGKPIVFGKPAATESLAFAGELFAIGGLESALFPTPKKAPEFKPLGERGGISIIKKKKKLPPKVQKIEAREFLEPKILKAKAPKGLPRPQVELLKTGKPKKPFGRDVFLKAPPKPPELGKALTPIGKPLTFEEKAAQRFITGKLDTRAFEIRKVTPTIIQTPKGKVIKEFIAVPVKKVKVPKVIKPTPKTVIPFKKAPELGEFLQPIKPLTFKEKAAQRFITGKLKPKAFEIRKVTPIPVQTVKGKPTVQQFIAVPVTKAKVTPLVKKTPLVFKEVPTTAALSKIKPLPFKEFTTKIETIVKPVVKIPAVKPPVKLELLIPESLTALSRGLARAKPISPISEEKPIAKLSPLEEEIRATTIISRPKIGEFLGVTPLTKEEVKPREKVEILEKVGIAPVSLEIPKEKDREREIIKPIELVIPKIRIETLPRELPKEIPVEIPREQIRERERERIRDLTITEIVDVFKPPRRREKERERQKELYKPRKPLFPLLFPPPLKRIKIKKPKRFEPGFIPITRKAGKEIPLTAFPVTKEAARAIAQFAVIHKPRASYKLAEVSAPAIKIKYPRLPKGIEKMFRPAKTLKGFMVEKQKYRIDQPGEFRGITLKGIEALRFKKRKKKKRKNKRR